MPAQLLALTDGPSIILDKPIVLLGRHGECDVQLNSRKVSRRHCALAQVNDYLVVRDLGSTNGVRINGKRVAEGRLNGGDELTVGNFRYQVHLDGNGKSPPPIIAGASRESADDDSLLESAEHPVAIPEKPKERPKAPPAIPPLPIPAPVAEPAKPLIVNGANGSAKKVDESSLILPDALRAKD